MRTEERGYGVKYLYPANMAPDGSGMNRLKWETFLQKTLINAELNTINIEYWIKLVGCREILKTSSAGDTLPYYFMKYFV